MIGSRLKHTEMSVAAREEHLGEVRDFVARICRAAGLDTSDISNFKLAVDEACTNIIQHAYRGHEGTIHLDVAYRSGHVELRLIDQGTPFDFESVKAPDLEHYVAIGKRGGLGIYLINKIMDDVAYTSGHGDNELLMVMDRRPAVDRWIPGLNVTGIHRSLRMRFFLRASFGLLLLVGAALGILHWNQRVGIREANFGKAEAAARTLAVKAQSVLAAGEAYGVERTLLQQSLVELLAADHDIARAQVVRAVDGSVWADNELSHLFQAHVARTGEPIDANDGSASWLRVLDEREGELLELRYPVRLGGRSQRGVTLGTVILAVRADAITHEMRRALLETTSIGLVAFLVGSALIFLMVNLFVRPIQRLTEGVLAIGDGVLEKDIQVDGPEEISTIAQAFNEIAGKFRHAQAHLVEQERLQKEMQLAREIQHTLLPKEMPKLSGYDIAAMYRAAAEVGGDYYDFFTVDEDTTGIVVADVSGKGIPGSLVMTMIRTALRMEARGNHSASDVMARVNTFITGDMRKGMFITLFYIILDSHNRVVSYASAGHNPMLLYRVETDEVFFLNPKGFPVGISLPDPDLFARTIAVEKLQLQQGDLLLAYTDGVTEAMNAQREQYGEERLMSCVRANAHLDAEDFVAALDADVTEFTSGNPQNDDITVVAVKEKLRPAHLEIARRRELLDMVAVEGLEIEEACRIYGVSTSTYYRWRRLVEKGGDEALAGQAKSSRLRRLNVEEREQLIGLVRDAPDLGARRLSNVLVARGYDLTQRMVYEELVRLELNNEAMRRAYLRRRGWTSVTGDGLDRSLLPPPPEPAEEDSPEDVPA